VSSRSSGTAIDTDRRSAGWTPPEGYEIQEKPGEALGYRLSMFSQGLGLDYSLICRRRANLLPGASSAVQGIGDRVWREMGILEAVRCGMLSRFRPSIKTLFGGVGGGCPAGFYAGLERLHYDGENHEHSVSNSSTVDFGTECGSLQGNRSSIRRARVRD